MAAISTVISDMNIPAISVRTMVATLSSLYVSAIRSGLGPRKIPSVFLWGAPGVGKTQGVYEIAYEIGKSTGKKVTVTDIRLLLFSPTDLRGLPVKMEEKVRAADAKAGGDEEKRQFAEWLRPKVFDLDPSEDTVNFLFLDELSACSPSVQAAAYQITLDRTVGEHKLPDNTIIIAAGNRTTDRSVAYIMPRALSNRMMHFQIEVDWDSWHKWAVRNRIHPLVTGYLSYAPSKLYCEPESKHVLAYPTPRTWQFLSDLLFMNGVTEETTLTDAMRLLVGSCIGTGASIEFCGWCNVYRSLPSARDICEGSKAPYPRKQDVLFALVSSLVSYVSAKEGISRAELENLCRYVERFPADFKALLYSDLLEIPGMDKKLVMVPEFRTWAGRPGR